MSEQILVDYEYLLRLMTTFHSRKLEQNELLCIIFVH